jgi:D-glycero-D-manno-heptose 1,7-bisphosphate phosphatase
VEGIRARIHRPAAPDCAPRPAVFLDRDGVIVEETGYLHHLDDLRLLDGAAAAIATLNRQGWPVVVVTNQAGIGRAYYGWSDFEMVEDAMEQEIGRAGGWVDGVWACAYHPRGQGEYARDHDFRKPNPGMLTAAAAALRLDLSGSWLVGDKTTDLEAAVRAGLPRAVLVETGYGRRMRAEVERLAAGEWHGRCAIHVLPSLAAAVELITRPL